jgi:hypothetical protein
MQNERRIVPQFPSTINLQGKKIRRCNPTAENLVETMSEALKKQLAEAEAAYRLLLERGRSSRVPLPEYLSAQDRILEAERALAVATGDQYAVPHDLGFHPDASVSAPMILQNDSSAFLTFSAVKDADGSRSTGTAVIEFDLCLWTMFGYPNDEALAGHPLYGRGLSAYRIFEVRNSHWVRRKTEQNRVSFPNTKDSDSRHLIFSFHDSTFECICRGIKSSTFSVTEYVYIFSDLSKRILDRHNAFL